MRTLIVVRHKATAQDLWDSWGPFSQPLLATDPTRFRTMRELFDDDPDAVMITVAAIVRQGVVFPSDTLVLIGPGIDGPELEQIRARARRVHQTNPLHEPARDPLRDWQTARIEAEADSEPEYVPPKVSWWDRIILGVVVSIAVGGVLWIWAPWLRG